MAQQWADYEIDVLRYRDLVDRVATVERNRATGKQSGVEVAMQTFSLCTLRDGKIVRWHGYSLEEEALEAAWLRD